MAISEQKIQELISKARRMVASGKSYIELHTEITKDIEKIDPLVDPSFASGLAYKIYETSAIQPDYRKKERSGKIEAVAGLSEAGIETAKHGVSWAGEKTSTRELGDKVRDSLASRWKRAKAYGLSAIGDKEGAERELRHVGEMSKKREVEEEQRVIRGEILNQRLQYAKAASDADREKIRKDITNLQKEMETLQNLKADYYSLRKTGRAAGTALRKPFMGRISNANTGWEPERQKMLAPQDRSSLNTARKRLRQFANQLFNTELSRMKKQLDAEEKKLKKVKDYYEKQRDRAESAIRGRTNGQNFLDSLADNKDDPERIGAMAGAASRIRGQRLLAEELRESFQMFTTAQARVEQLQQVATTQGTIKIVDNALNRNVQEQLEREGLSSNPVAKGMLDKEKDILMFRFKARYRNRMMRGMAALRQFSYNMSMGAMTWSDVWLTFWYNIRDFIFGPWVWGSIIVIIQWLLVGNYIQPVATSGMHFFAPIGFGALTLLLNLETSAGKPWDWLTHFIVGMMIAFSSLILITAVLTPEDMAGWGNSQWLFFWFIWGGGTLFVGVFSIYQSGGFLFVLQLSLLIIVFGWFALGPWKAAYQDVVDQIRAPIAFVYNAFKGAFEDVWLLATNPQEYFARQQLKNVQSSNTIRLPDGVEINGLEVNPKNPQMGEGESQPTFAISFEVRNQGKETANDVKARLNCDAFCNKNTNIAFSDDTTLKNPLRVGEAEIIRFRNIPSYVTGGTSKRDHLTTSTAEVYVSYEYPTSSSLSVRVASPDEYRRILRDGILDGVVAKGKSTPAQISLSVGKQPLEAGEEYDLFVSVLNTRPDGHVFLNKQTPIRIRMPTSIGTDLNCAGLTGQNLGTNVEEILVVPGGLIDIQPNKFSSLFAFSCKFKAASVEKESRTGLITAEIDSYIFEVRKDVKIRYSPPTGASGLITENIQEFDPTACANECKIENDIETQSLNGKWNGQKCIYETVEFCQNGCNGEATGCRPSGILPGPNPAFPDTGS
jgi:hypothetical protein